MQSPYQRVNSGFFLVCGQPELPPFSMWCTVILWYAQRLVLGPPHIPKSVHNQNVHPPLWNSCILKVNHSHIHRFQIPWILYFHPLFVEKNLCLRGPRQFKLTLFKNQRNFLPCAHQKLWEAHYFVTLFEIWRNCIQHLETLIGPNYQIIDIGSMQYFLYQNLLECQILLFWIILSINHFHQLFLLWGKKK